MSQSSPLPDADVVQTGPLVPTRILNISATNINNQNNQTTYHEVETVPTRTGGIDEFRCQHIDYQYDIALATICSMYLLFGIVYSLFGYRCFKAIMFLTGFIFGSIIVYLICLQEKLLPSYGNAGVAISAGILFGLITMLVQYVGLFVTGFHTGLFGAVVAVVIAEQCSQITSVWMVAGILLSGGLLFAMLNLYWQKGLTIIGTSIYGGAIISIALDYFVEKLQMLHWIWSRISLKENYQPCWFSWLILSVWPFMVLVGLITQFTVTGIGIHHEEMVPSKKTPVQRVRTREQRAEMRQKKYRYLYQVRTAHGDVISQGLGNCLLFFRYLPMVTVESCLPSFPFSCLLNPCGTLKSFVQALQRKALTPNQCDQGDMNTIQSDSTHLSHLPSDQTAQLAALTESEDDLNDSREISGNIIAGSQSSVNIKTYR